MDAVKRKKILLVVMAIFIFGACSLLDRSTSNNDGADLVEPTAIVSPTPNQTLTAVFSQATANAPDPDQPTETAEADPAVTTESTDDQLPEVTPTTPPTPTSLAYAETPSVAVVGHVSAHYLNASPVIDGVLDDWPGEMYTMSEVVYGGEYYANASDLSGQFKVAWDDSNLYLGVVVFDTRFSQTATGTQMFMGDSLEILMDTNLSGDASDTELSADDYQIGISPGNLHDVAIPEAYMWYPSDKIGTLPGVEIKGTLINAGYVVEVAMPWSVVGVTPTNGKILGFLFSISDNDMQFMNAQQTVVSFSASRELQNPTTWSELKLIKP